MKLNSPPSSAEVKGTWTYTSTPQYVFTAWCLIKHSGSCTFTMAVTLLVYGRSIEKEL